MAFVVVVGHAQTAPKITGEKAVLACMSQSIALESAYAALMAEDQDSAIAALERIGVPAEKRRIALDGLKQSIAVRSPKSPREVSAIVAPRFEQCLGAHGVVVAASRGAACYRYADIVRLIFKYKGQGANSLLAHLDSFEAGLVPATARRAASTTSDQVEFEVSEISVCLDVNLTGVR